MLFACDRGDFCAGFRADTFPVCEALGIEFYELWLDHWVVIADAFDPRAVSAFAAVSDDNAVKWDFLTPHASESDDCHIYPLCWYMGFCEGLYCAKVTKFILNKECILAKNS